MAVTLHTSLGDIKLELYCDLAPRTCEVSGRREDRVLQRPSPERRASRDRTSWRYVPRRPTMAPSSTGKC
jgi:hypothetical protein